MASVIAEIVFIIGPVLAASLAIITLPNSLWQVGGILLYVFLSMLPMLIMTIMVGSGHSVARLQRWRERNKRFLQFVGGGSLFILAAFIFVDRILGIITYGGL
jgi:threonine/homoserine/homoserine lactone efflux protein